MTKNKKEYKKEYKRVQFWSTKSTVLEVCTLLLFFVLEKSGHPDRKKAKKVSKKNENHHKLSKENEKSEELR